MTRRLSARLVVVALAVAASFVFPDLTGASPSATAAVSTTTSVSASPVTSYAGTSVVITATVSPIPDGGTIEFYEWNAATGGTGLPVVDPLPVNSNGKAIISDNFTPFVGDHWFEARFSGTSYFAPSGSTRFKITVLANTPTLAAGVPTSVPEGGYVTVNYTISSAQASLGLLELWIDGSPYLSRNAAYGTSLSFQFQNALDIGPHSLQVRIVPSDFRWGPGISPAIQFTVGTFAPSSPVINYDRFATRSTSVVVNPPATDGGQSVTSVRIANTSTLAGGLLVDGTTFTRQNAINWSLASGADGQRTVWVQLRHTDGSWTAPLTDTIYYDTTPPSGSFQMNGGAATVGDPWGGPYESAVSGSISDASLAAAGSITHLAASNDGQRWAVIPFAGDPSSFSLDWYVEDETFGGNPEMGPKTVYMKWRDQAGNWSTPVSDDIKAIDRDRVGWVLIDGDYGYGFGTGYIDHTSVTLTFDIDYVPPEGIDHVVIWGPSFSPTKTVAWQQGLAVSWSLTNTTYGYTTADDPKRVWVDVYTKTDRHQTIGAMEILDRAVPTAGAPRPTISQGSVVDLVTTTSSMTSLAATSTTVAADIRWTGKDGGAVASYRLQRSLNAGLWSSVTLADPTVPAFRQTMQTGTTYAFRARSIDAAGNISAWKTGPTFKLAVRQETSASIVYSGTWRTETRSDAFGGTLRNASTQGSKAKLTFTGRSVSWVAPRSAAGDAADVYIDGVRIKTVYLSLSTGYFPRRVVFTYSWSSSGTHTIKIVKKFANSLLLPLDAFLVLT